MEAKDGLLLPFALPLVLEGMSQKYCIKGWEISGSLYLGPLVAGLKSFVHIKQITDISSGKLYMLYVRASQQVRRGSASPRIDHSQTEFSEGMFH